MVIPYDPPGAHGEKVPHTTRGYPGTVSLINHLIKNHGGRSLGIYNNRSVRGGHATSLHAVSRATDWGYDDRAEAQRVLNALTRLDGNLARALGVQAIHDYATQHPTQSSLRRTWGHGRGWHWGHIGWGGNWLHIELTEAAAKDANLLARVWQEDNNVEPEHHEGGDHDAEHQARTMPHPTQKVGSHNHEVALLQTVLQDWHRARGRDVSNPGPADGRFGVLTERSLIGFQNKILHVKPDGIFGPNTATALEVLAKYLAGLGG